MKLFKKCLFIAVGSAMFISCQKQENTTSNAPLASTELPVKKESTSQKGHHVPNDEVCMVNNAHMGSKQMEVPFNGKMYYGCCAMCVERIPKDVTVRTAIDPFSGEKIDKATAYIIVLNDKGAVAYFKNESNYSKFMQANQ